MAALGASEISNELARLGAGDRSRAKAVFEALWPVVVRFCTRWLDSAHEAEDCAQRAIARVFEQSATFDSTRDAMAWALELAIWECRTARARQRRARAVSIDEAADRRSPASDPSDEAERRELESALAAAMNELSPAHREELARFLADDAAGDAASRKRRQRAIEQLKVLWRRLHGDDS